MEQMAFDNVSYSKNKSTNGRAIPWQLRALRAGFHALGDTAPEFAVKAAEKLFFKARRAPRPAAEHELIERGQASRVPAGGGHLCAWSWGEGPTVLLVHGWEGRGAQLGAFVDPLVDAGFRVLAFDAPGHGDTPIERASLMDHADAVTRILDEVGGAHAIIGHSMGGSAAAVAMSRRQLAERFVFIAPPVDPRRFTETVSRTLGIRAPLMQALKERVEERYAVRFEELSVVTAASKVRGPLLVVHDKGDRDVPFEDGQAITEAWEGAHLLATEGLGHRRVLKDPEVVARVVSFLREERTRS